MLYQNKNNVYYLGVDTYVKLLLDCVELLNLMKNKNTNYIISWEKRGNPIKYIPVLLSKFATSNINKANNYYRGGYILFIYPYQLNQIVVTSINLL